MIQRLRVPSCGYTLPVTKGAWRGSRTKPTTGEKQSPLIREVSSCLCAGILVFYVVGALIVPLTVAGATFWFTRWHTELVQRRETAQKERESTLEEQRFHHALSLKQQRAQDEVFQKYLDRLAQPLTSGKLRKAGRFEEVRVLARTLGVLWKLDANRKRSLMQFLHEARLIRREEFDREAEEEPVNPVIGLSGADLRKASLQELDLKDAALNGADMKGANLRDAKLNNVNLSGADLSGADLSNANLNGASLVNADLQRKDELKLSGADLSSADPKDADLTGADLRGVKGVNKEKLKAQAKSLKGAAMPEESSPPSAPRLKRLV
jgi:Pentapeptide repeats (8 copies)